MASNNLEMKALPPASVRREGTSLAFGYSAVRAILPHRGRMLLIDRVSELSLAERTIAALKSCAQNDPGLMESSAQGRYFSQALLTETAAQACGFLMNVLNALDATGLSDDEFGALLADAKVPAVVPLSVLADSKMKHLDLVRPGEQIEVAARVAARRAEMWHFTFKVRVGRPVAQGEMLLAYPSYMKEAAK